MPMTTNDIRVLALLIGVDPTFLSCPDDELLALVYHECAHRAQRGEGHFKAFYDSLPNDIAIKFMVDRRTLDWMLRNKSYLFTDTNKPTLAERLEQAAEHLDAVADTVILSNAVEDALSAILEAAKLLRKHGLDK